MCRDEKSETTLLKKVSKLFHDCGLRFPVSLLLLQVHTSSPTEALKQFALVCRPKTQFLGSST
jgi:hypothetical protein